MARDTSRRQVLAYRMAAQGLGRDVTDAFDLDVLALGLQHTSIGTIRLALAARLPEVPAGKADPVADEKRYAVLWSVRGAPHLHRRADLRALAGALWPLSDADAMTRLAAERAAMKKAGISGLQAFTAAANAVRAVVTKPRPKGDVSAGVTTRLPAAYSYACRSCKATHVYGGIFQLVGLPAGIRHEPDTSPPILTPLEGRPAVPSKASGTQEVVRSYLRLHGPATPADVASYVGTSQTHLRPVWPDDGLAEVTVDGRRCWIPADRTEALRDAAPPGVRLVPAYDPFLQSRDRDLLVPDPARQKEVWKILGNPGAVVVDGEVAGTWRSRTTGKKRLTLTVQPFGTLTKKVRNEIEDEAQRIGVARGTAEVAVTYDKS
jgi:Winged helix DNA-binding domain